MDDVDAVQGQIARNMLHSGDWVSAQLDGVKYLEKSPLKYWMMAVSMAIFGEHDWAARLPIAFSTILLCWRSQCLARRVVWTSVDEGSNSALLCLPVVVLLQQLLLLL